MGQDRLVAGRYRLVERLGAGGMGVVWQAHDERLDRTVAVKQLLLPVGVGGAQADEARRLAVREGRIAARLQHQNSIMVYDVAEDAGQAYLVMEYLPSMSLSQVLAERTALSPAEVARIGAEAAAGLASAHAVGVVHRDVKPGNVLLSDDGRVKITDFGISRAVEDVTATITGMITGTPGYLAPEVAKGERATFASDVFSLGSTLYTAVEGRPPFGQADNPMAVLYRVASGRFEPPRQAGPLTEVLDRLMRVDQGERPSMARAAAELTAVAGPPLPAGRAAPVVLTDGRRDEPDRSAPDGAAGTDRTADTDGAIGTYSVPGAVGAAGPAAAAGATGAAAGPAGPAPGEAARVHPPTRTDLPPVRPDPPAAADRPPAPRDSRDRHGRKDRNQRRTVLVAAAVVLAATVVGLWLLMRDPDRGTTGAPVASSTQQTGQPTGQPTSQQPAEPPAASGSAGQPATTTQPTSAEETASPADPPAAGTPAQAIVDYYALMPRNVDEGFTRLTSRYQQSPAGGFDGYRAYWRQMSSVLVSDVVAGDGDGVRATVEYHFTTGRVVREVHTYFLVQQGGRWLIDRSTVDSSVQVQ